MKRTNRKRNLICGYLSLMLLAALICACAAGDAGPQSSTPEILKSYVDIQNGSDETGNGSDLLPYRTITYALSVVSPQTKIILLDGEYDGASGEIFPIQLNDGISLVASSQNGVFIHGSGSYTSSSTGTTQDVAIVIDDDLNLSSVVASAGSLSIQTDGTGIGIWIENAQGNNTVKGITASDNFYGIVVAGEANPQIINCIISENTNVGVGVFNTASPSINLSTITSNRIGIDIGQLATPSIGTAETPGGNNFSDNSDADICNETPNAINTIGNIWSIPEDEILLVNSCSDGAILANPGGGVIVLVAPPGTSVLFPGTQEIILLEPSIGSVILTLRPDFVWEVSGEKYVFVAVFDEKIQIKDGTISNPTGIVWEWNTGMSGSEGDIEYNQGASVVEGSVIPGTPATLEEGKSYYWAVWAWDNKGLIITRSSPVGYFYTGS